jgi:hypothetical protein
MSDQREPRRPVTDPIAAGVDAVAAGYRTVEYVIEAFTESLRRRPETGPVGDASAFRRAEEAAGTGAETRARREARARRSGRAAGGRAARGGRAVGGGRDGVSGTVPGDLADLTAELFDRFGEVMHSLADAIGERAAFERGPQCPTIELQGHPGETVDVKFQFTNTGPSALSDVAFEATDLMGPTDRIKVDRAGTDERIPRVRPGGSAVACVKVKIPETAAPGLYRGVVTARPEAPAGRRANEERPDAWALLELEVTPPQRARPRVDDDPTAGEEPPEVS